MQIRYSVNIIDQDQGVVTFDASEFGDLDMDQRREAIIAEIRERVELDIVLEGDDEVTSRPVDVPGHECGEELFIRGAYLGTVFINRTQGGWSAYNACRATHKHASRTAAIEALEQAYPST